jgi:hypothetical protein
MKKLLLVMIGILLIGSVSALTKTQNVTVTILPGAIDVFSPVQDAIYNERMVLINLSMSAKVKFFKYSIDGDDKLVTLCRNCDSFSRKKPFDDGFIQLTIFGMFDEGNVIEKRNFTVDTKKPKILKTKPGRGFATGLFEVEFQEANPVSLILSYGNNVTGYRNSELNLNGCEEKRTKKICNTTVNLEDYDGQEVEYWFNITDIVGNMDESKKRKLDVDVSKPIIENFNFTINKKYVTFLLNISEPNFDNVNYIDNSDLKPRWKLLCSTLKKGVCKKKISFRVGNHDLTIQVLDKAGNSVEFPVEFTII